MFNLFNFYSIIKELGLKGFYLILGLTEIKFYRIFINGYISPFLDNFPQYLNCSIKAVAGGTEEARQGPA